MSDETEHRSRDPRPRVAAWWRHHQGLIDATIAAGLWVVCSAVFVVSLGSEPAPGDVSPYPSSRDGEAMLLLGVTTLQTAPLAWRRSRPELSFALVALGHVGQLLVTDGPVPGNITALISAYAVASYSERLWVRRAGLAAAAVGGILAPRDWVGYRESNLTGQVMSFAFIGGMAMVCWLWGDLARRRRELVARLQEQNEALRRDRDQRARIAAQDERTRIAREMHDIVAHSLSVVVVQADGAAYTAEHAADFDRAHAGRALTTIGTTAREALAETRRLVGVLRTTEGEGGGPTALEYTPTETLAELQDLVDRVAASGVDVVLAASPDLTTVPRETGLAAYRIVQESLTNVLKHAGPGARARVALTADTDLHLEVRDDGRGAASPDDGHGHGLIGMRERAASVGGRVTAAPAPGGGYLITATLPLRQELT